jgi:hypothetical protein
MSRILPARPNLEHLKKQARGRLSELRRDDPAAQLSDALHAAAREYGFSNWPVLKEHVESVRAASGGTPFDGGWTARLGASPEPLLRLCDAATLEFAVEGDLMTLSETVLEPSGAERRNSYTLRVGGPLQRVDHGYVMAAVRQGSRVLKVSIDHGGEHVMDVTYTVSDDGRTLTLTATTAAHAGYPAIHQTIVFERAGG